MSHEPANLLGLRFGKLVVKARVAVTPSGCLWDCACDCGGRRVILTTNLKSTHRPACKACEFETRSLAKTTHGASPVSGKTKLYEIWKGMHSRCRDPGNTSYRYYGGKGISVCAEWSTFEPFRDWALANGYSEGLSIDREKSDQNYEPRFCSWVTRSENSKRAHVARRAQRELVARTAEALLSAD